MVTEWVIKAIVAVVRAIEALVPSVSWPSWLSAPSDWMASVGSSVNLNAVFAYIHPYTVDMVLLTFTLASVERIVRRIRAMVSTATGGGGVSQ